MIVGGHSNSDGFLDTVEAFDFKTSWKSLASVPDPVDRHCVVSLNQTVLLSIGGRVTNDVTSKTHFYNYDTDSWTRGPDLETPRFYSSCAKVNFKNPFNDQTEMAVVVAGGQNSTSAYLSSTEILYLNNPSMGWQSGPDLPGSVSGAVLVEFGSSVVLVGSIAHGDGRNLYQLSSPEGPWIKMEQRLPMRKKFQYRYPHP